MEPPRRVIEFFSNMIFISIFASIGMDHDYYHEDPDKLFQLYKTIVSNAIPLMYLFSMIHSRRFHPGRLKGSKPILPVNNLHNDKSPQSPHRKSLRIRGGGDNWMEKNPHFTTNFAFYDGVPVSNFSERILNRINLQLMSIVIKDDSLYKCVATETDVGGANHLTLNYAACTAQQQQEHNQRIERSFQVIMSCLKPESYLFKYY